MCMYLTVSQGARCAGSAEICKRLDSLEHQVVQGFDAVLKAIEDKEAAEIARQFNTKLEWVALKYKELVGDIADAVENTDQRCQGLAGDLAKSDAIETESRADELYVWAKGLVPASDDIGGSRTPLGMAGILGAMPYVVAMAYAIRVKVDARLVKSHSIASKGERKRYLERSRSMIKEFVTRLRSIVMTIVRDASLLEIALDYHLALTTYVMLIASMEASAEIMVDANGAKPKTIPVWNDGLSKLR